MRKILIALVLLLVLGGVLAITSRDKGEQDAPVPQAQFPIGAYTGRNAPASLSLVTRDGETLPVQNFLNNGTTITDMQNPGTYVVAGELGYCTEDGRCPTTGDTGYTVSYFVSDQAFMIGLGEEPLGEVRLRAEERLRTILGLTEKQMCELKITVGTTVYVNETYGAMENLGLSFCPGAVPLP